MKLGWARVLGKRSERRVRVLLVEDDRLSRILIEETLSDFAQIELTTASTVADATLVLSSSLEFDIVLLDWRLDGRNAQTVLDIAELRGPDRRPQVVLVTGSILPEEIKGLVPTQIDRILTKPIEIDELIQIVLDSANRCGGATRGATLSA